MTYHNSLQKIYHRWLIEKSLSPSRRESTSSRINFTHLNTPEKRRWYSNLHLRLENEEKQLERMRDKIDHLMKVSRVIVGQELSNDFKSIIEDMTEDIRKNNPPDSFKQVFWEQQLAAVNASDVQQIRWHPAIIKWYLHMKFLSSGAYHAMRSSGLFVLPFERTLREYTHFVKGRAGFCPELNAQLVEEARISEDKDRYIVLLWDEMKIKEDLVFDKHSCELIGFVNCGYINGHLDNFEHQCNSEENLSQTCSVASHMVLFTVRGLFTSLEFPYAQFPTNNASGDVLYPIVWEAVSTWNHRVSRL